MVRLPERNHYGVGRHRQSLNLGTSQNSNKDQITISVSRDQGIRLIKPETALAHFFEIRWVNPHIQVSIRDFQGISPLPSPLPLFDNVFVG